MHVERHKHSFKHSAGSKLHVDVHAHVDARAVRAQIRFLLYANFEPCIPAYHDACPAVMSIRTRSRDSAHAVLCTSHVHIVLAYTCLMRPSNICLELDPHCASEASYDILHCWLR